MLEKKTTDEIQTSFWEQYESFNNGSKNLINKEYHKLIELKNKVWISEESLKETLETYMKKKHACHSFYEFKKELEGEEK